MYRISQEHLLLPGSEKLLEANEAVPAGPRATLKRLSLAKAGTIQAAKVLTTAMDENTLNMFTFLCS